jgi:hypothetical protein
VPTSYERISHSWQLDTLRVGLNFLALDERAKAAYLPDNFPEITFHMRSSDMVCSNPLAFMAAFCEEACHIDDASEAVGESLLRIVGVLSSLGYEEREPYWRARKNWLDEIAQRQSSVHVWDALRFLADDALRQLGWVLEHPARSCSDLLDEFSGGVYSEVTRNV